MYKTVDYNGRKLTLKYTNDEIFKYILTSNDSDEYTCFLLHAIVDKTIEQISFMSTENVNRVGLKKQIYDTLISDQDNNDYIVEMQNGPITFSNGVRFQNYSNSRCVQKITKGSNYEFQGMTDLIVFTTHRFGDRLLNIYDLKDMKGESFPFNLQHYYVVSLPFVIEIDLEKGYLTDLEAISYMFYYGNVDGVYNLLNEIQRRMVNFMERKYNEIFDDAFLLPKAVVEALDKLEKEEIKNIYHQEGFEMGKNLGVDIGKTEEREDKYNEYMNNLPNLLRLLYGEVDTDWLKMLSYDKLAELFNLMSSGISYDVLKKHFIF